MLVHGFVIVIPVLLGGGGGKELGNVRRYYCGRVGKESGN